MKNKKSTQPAKKIKVKVQPQIKPQNPKHPQNNDTVPNISQPAAENIAYSEKAQVTSCVNSSEYLKQLIFKKALEQTNIEKYCEPSNIEDLPPIIHYETIREDEKKRTSRPKLERNHQVKTRLTDAEMEYFMERVKESGMKQGEFMRACLLRGSIATPQN